MQKDKKSSGFYSIVSKMNTNILPKEGSSPIIFDDNKKTDKQNTVAAGLELNINTVVVNPLQPRKIFDEKSLEELASSIREHGIIQPIIVTKKDKHYIIVAGERRYRAARIAGLNKIPVIVKDLSEKERRELALIENIQREELNPIEEAEAMKVLIDEYGMTQEQLAASLGKSRPAVANVVRLLKLPELIIEMVRTNKLTNGHARALLSIKNAQTQIKFAKEVILKRMSVRELELKVNRYMLNKDAVPPKKSMSLELKAMERALQRVFATKVKICGSDKKGKIVIDYFSSDELQKIYDLVEDIKNK